MKNKDLKIFGQCAIKNTETEIERVLAFLFFYKKNENRGLSIKEVLNCFKCLGLSVPNSSRLRLKIKNNKNTFKFDDDAWQLSVDKAEEIGNKFNLNQCLFLNNKKQKTKNGWSNYVDIDRIRQLIKINENVKKFDLSRLIKMCEEINDNFNTKNYISTIVLLRAIMDHLPPVFRKKNFSEIANSRTKSIKNNLLNLEKSSRNISDNYLHLHINKKDSLPTRTQVDFSQDLDVLIGEVLKELSK